MTAQTLQFGDRLVGPGHPTLIVAELSCNHRQQYQVAVDTILAAKEAGADAIKLQTYTPDTITLPHATGPFVIQSGTPWSGRAMYDLYKEAFTPWEWHAPLQQCATEAGLLFFSSPFDYSAVDFLDELGVPAFKIASFEITDIPLIKHTAKKGKPVILSTGIAELDEIHAAIEAIRGEGNDQIVVLKCTSAYPTPLEEVNLNTLADIAIRFGVTVGLSDHTLHSETAVAAVTLGGRIVEKHLILDKQLGGPDAAFSLDPLEFRALVDSVRRTELLLGKVSYDLSPRAQGGRQFSRSLFVSADIQVGEELTPSNVRSVRPNAGLAPKHLPNVLGKRAKRAIRSGTPLAWDLLE